MAIWSVRDCTRLEALWLARRTMARLKRAGVRSEQQGRSTRITNTSQR